MTDKTENRRTKKLLRHWHLVTIYLGIYDAFAVSFAYFLALWIRFDCRFQSIPPIYLRAVISFAPMYSLFSLLVFSLLRLYKSIWRFASYIELARVGFATLVTGIAHVIGITYLHIRMPITYYVFGIVIQFILILGVRFSYRLVLLERARRKKTGKLNHGRILLIGAGSAGRMILHDINSNNKTDDRIVCIIDDNRNKWNRYIDDIPVVGGRDDILNTVKKFGIDKIYLAIPSAGIAVKRDILNICKESGCELKSLPDINNLPDDIRASSLQEVKIEDLLGRDQIKVNLDEIFDYLQNKTILVTGGGGSIGSELCRQIAAHSPKQLIIFDIYENNAYDIQFELKNKYPSMDLVVLIGSVRDIKRVRYVFEKYKPDVVYHAAAHKHVPLMENSPNEAIKNNVIGTYNTAYAAMMYGCKRFVLISTDKAVNPTNIMGASKRLCEMVIQSFAKSIAQKRVSDIPPTTFDKNGEVNDEQLSNEKVNTEFAAVRFGNVLGSNGSVVPMFKKQIEMGGPVTITHPDIIRYFMTIPEAVSLVLQAGTYAMGGEIFVLDMGEPVKIETMARNLIKLSGLRPDEDIKIEYTGLRPGEKLFEEKLMSEEGLKKTMNQLIHIAKPIDFDIDKFYMDLKMLAEIAYNNSDEIFACVQKVAGTYTPSGECAMASLNETAKKTVASFE